MFSEDAAGAIVTVRRKDKVVGEVMIGALHGDAVRVLIKRFVPKELLLVTVVDDYDTDLDDDEEDTDMDLDMDLAPPHPTMANSCDKHDAASRVDDDDLAAIEQARRR
jgi:hypothetical protein